MVTIETSFSQYPVEPTFELKTRILNNAHARDARSFQRSHAEINVLNNASIVFTACEFDTLMVHYRWLGLPLLASHLTCTLLAQGAGITISVWLTIRLA